MSNPEGIQSNESHESSPLELALLRDDLADLFQTHVDKATIHQPDNLEEPARVVLAGTFEADTASGTIQLWQRPENGRQNYLFMCMTASQNWWYMIKETEAYEVCYGTAAMNDDDFATARQLCSIAEWDAEESQLYAESFDAFGMVKNYS